MPQHIRFDFLRRGLALSFLLFLSSTIAGAQEQEPGRVFDIEMGVADGRMAFDKTAFSVAPGSTVNIHFNNNDAMIHNLIVASQTGGEEVYMAIAQMVLDLGSEAQAREFIPDSDLVLAASKLLQPGSRDTVTFTAPDEPGPYPYVCTFFGHARTMNGTMHVTADGNMPSERKESPPSGFSELQYRYYEGSWGEMPDFDRLDAIASGRVTGDLVSLEPARSEDYFGFAFEGRLPVEQPGIYTFFLRSDDGSMLSINGELVIDNDGLHGAEEIGIAEIDLGAGTHDLRLDYFEHSGGADLQLDWVGPGEERVSLLSANGRIPDPRKYIVEVQEEAQAWRVLLPDASARAVAVGLPEGTSYCFDPEVAAVRYAWQGDFINRGGMVGGGTGRGPSPVQILGARFEAGAVDRPLRLGNPSSEPALRFLGYHNTGTRIAFMYEVDGYKVTQITEGLQGSTPGLRHRFEFAEKPAAPVYFLVNGAGLHVTSTAGQWEGDVLALPAEDARAFSVTIANRSD